MELFDHGHRERQREADRADRPRVVERGNAVAAGRSQPLPRDAASAWREEKFERRLQLGLGNRHAGGRGDLPLQIFPQCEVQTNVVAHRVPGVDSAEDQLVQIAHHDVAVADQLLEVARGQRDAEGLLHPERDIQQVHSHGVHHVSAARS